MILAFLLVIVLCSVLSFPHYNGFSDSDIKIILTKNPKLLKDNDLDLVEQDFDEAQKQVGLFDVSKRQFRSNRSGSSNALPPKEYWSLQCAPYCRTEYRPDIINNEDNSLKYNNDDILLHLNDDKDLYKFLEWTMGRLGSSVNSYNTSGSYYSGMDMWKKGRGETPLYVEEPKYIVVRGDQDDFLEQKLNFDGHSEDIPFIPSRGRKFNPQWQDIVYEEVFIPNRRKKNVKKLKDILKYDEIFVPLHGKKRTSYVIDADDDDGVLRGKNKVSTSGGYQNYQSTAATGAAARENDHQTFGDCFTPRCVDITSALLAPSHQLVTTNQAGNINALVSAAEFHLPSLPWHAVLVNAYNKNNNQANTAADSDADGHQDADVACAVADCQKENDVKINGFDQSVRAQDIRQRQHSEAEGGAFNNQQRNRQQQQRRRRLLSSSSSAPASVEAGASTFFQPQPPSPLPLPPSRSQSASAASSSTLISQSDQLGRLQQYPIRNKQWRDYYVQEMAALSRRFPPF